MGQAAASAARRKNKPPGVTCAARKFLNTQTTGSATLFLAPLAVAHERRRGHLAAGVGVPVNGNIDTQLTDFRARRRTHLQGHKDAAPCPEMRSTVPAKNIKKRTNDSITPLAAWTNQSVRYKRAGALRLAQTTLRNPGNKITGLDNAAFCWCRRYYSSVICKPGNWPDLP